jgi:hypothetical protein
MLTINNNKKQILYDKSLLSLLCSFEKNKIYPIKTQYIKFLINIGADLFDDYSYYTHNTKSIKILILFNLFVNSYNDIINNEFVISVLNSIILNKHKLENLPVILFETVKFLNFIDIYNLAIYFINNGYNVNNMIKSILLASINVNYFSKNLFKKIIKLCNKNKLISITKLNIKYFEDNTDINIKKKHEIIINRMEIIQSICV